VSTTHVTDTHVRIISSDALPWDDIPTPGAAVAPERVSATYHGAVSPDGRIAWTVNAHVTGRRRGKTGRKIGDAVTVWYLVAPDHSNDDRESWPVWLVAWLEKYHPDRGGLDLDPRGSYL
jgi:hypothetical protein